MLKMNLTTLGKVKYIALETFRKNGEGVITPVWVTQEGNKLYVWTSADSWKVKRIRHNSRVRLCQSNARGKPEGEWLEAKASLSESPADVVAQRNRLAKKYGWQYRLFAIFNTLMARNRTNAVIEIS